MPRWAELTLLVNISLMIEGEGNLTPRVLTGPTGRQC